MQGQGGGDCKAGKSHLRDGRKWRRESEVGHRQSSWDAYLRLRWALRVRDGHERPSLTCQLHPAELSRRPWGRLPQQLAALPETFWQILASSSDGKTIS